MTAIKMTPATRRISRGALWRVCLVAMALLLAVIAGSHLLFDWMAGQQAQHARIINLAGKQRSLSQRIAGRLLEASQAESPRLGLIGSLHGDLNRFETNHLKLTDRTADRVARTLNPQVRRLYFEDEPSVDDRVERFLATARDLMARIEAGESVDPARLTRFVGRARGPLLAALDNVVEGYQADAETQLDRLRWLNGALLVIAVGVVLVELLLVFRPLVRRLDAVQRELEDVARTDPLTGCWNRRALMQTAGHLWSVAERGDRELTIVMCDIDHFKAVNDTHGHAVGDDVIAAFAATCLATVRRQDVLGRYGGEEFTIVLPDTDADGARELAERIRAALAAGPVEAGAERVAVTASFGIATRRPGDRDVHDIVERADAALYAAKRAGRNRTETWREALAA